MAHRVISQIAIVGCRILGRAFLEAYKQAQASSKYARANGSTSTASSATIRTHAGLTLDEAYRILNIKPVNGTLPPLEEVTTRHVKLFEANDPKNGGSLYLQSKIIRSRERIEVEIAKTTEKIHAS